MNEVTMNEVWTRSGRKPVYVSKPAHVCSNPTLRGGRSPMSAAPRAGSRVHCSRASVKVVQADLPQVSGASAILAALLLVAVAFGVLFIGTWRVGSATSDPAPASAPSQVAFGMPGGHE